MKKSELKSIIRECIEEMYVNEKYNERQRSLKKAYKASQDTSDEFFPGDKGRDPLTYGKNLYIFGRDPKRINASTTTKASKHNKASKADTNKVKYSIMQSFGKGDNDFAPHHPKPRPKLPR